MRFETDQPGSSMTKCVRIDKNYDIYGNLKYFMTVQKDAKLDTLTIINRKVRTDHNVSVWRLWRNFQDDGKRPSHLPYGQGLERSRTTNFDDFREPSAMT